MLEITELQSRLNKILDRNDVLVSENKEIIEASITTYDLLPFNFSTLMKVAEIFGTTDFDIIDTKVDGRVWSEVTVESDTFIKSFIVKKSLLK